MNKPSPRERLTQARVYLTHGRVQLQAVEKDVDIGDAWGAIVDALTAATEAERKCRHALDSLCDGGTGSEDQEP